MSEISLLQNQRQDERDDKNKNVFPLRDYFILIFSEAFFRIVDNFGIIGLINPQNDKDINKKLEFTNMMDYAVVLPFILATPWAIRKSMVNSKKIYLIVSILPIITVVLYILIYYLSQTFTKRLDVQISIFAFVEFGFRFYYAFSTVYAFGYQMDLFSKKNENDSLYKKIIGYYLLVFQSSKIVFYALSYSLNNKDTQQIYILLITAFGLIGGILAYYVKPFELRQCQKLKIPQEQESNIQQARNDMELQNQQNLQQQELQEQLYKWRIFQVFKKSPVLEVIEPFSQIQNNQNQNQNSDQEILKKIVHIKKANTNSDSFRLLQTTTRFLLTHVAFLSDSIYINKEGVINCLCYEIGILLGLFCIFCFIKEDTKPDDIFIYLLHIGLLVSVIQFCFLLNYQESIKYSIENHKNQDSFSDTQKDLIKKIKIWNYVFESLLEVITGILWFMGYRIAIPRCRGEIEVCAWYLPLKENSQKVTQDCYDSNMINTIRILKIEKDIQNGLTEIKLLSKINQANIKGVVKLFNYTYSLQDNSIIMALEKGEMTLQTQINNDSNMEDYSNTENNSKMKTIKGETQLRHLFLNIVTTLDQLWNDHTILHNDIKPDNIIISSHDSQCKLIDFGVSIKLGKKLKTLIEKDKDILMKLYKINQKEERKKNQPKTNNQQILPNQNKNQDKQQSKFIIKLNSHKSKGTRQYKSPQKYNTDQNSSYPNPEKSEVYSLGIVFLQIITYNTALMDDSTIEEINEMKQKMNKNYNDQCYEKLKEIVCKMVESEENQRPTLQEIKQQLTNL